MVRFDSVGANDVRLGGSNQFSSPSFSSSSSLRHVNYSCGSCGYELNLSSSNRITSTIGSKYGKSIKSGIISFFNIDESRFTQVEEFRCIPHFSKNSWGLFRHRTKLLCRKCNNHIGTASQDKASAHTVVAESSDSSPSDVGSGIKKYDIRIRALQPSSSAQGIGAPFFS
ncbi:PREDICTED: uncharacterized protein At4g08330, chloroplastic isoform X1 [Tarenaya hassleriana]|uniref:uncharacterized protein At4g08330, chloroplastic isoform X1 n=1 Tax=Tarenaya hassleriana TaxID=28532 RepID=UPI00053CA6C8|nr:PREDICTED: uncharacterized protein At4g08330, chloroplastic isoform X1 [Tarenaya hassleriana]XP_010544798.1 PREDICTED: uncharacterized protein At4g08330, chloroplastic isoform X1 [Tarenaya hassleriana]